MNLEAKLGVSTAVLATSMVLCAITVHVRIAASDDLVIQLRTRQAPIAAARHDLDTQLGNSVNALLTSMLSSRDPNTSIAFLRDREESVVRAEAALAQFKDLLATEPLTIEQREQIQSLESDVTHLKEVEEQIERLNQANTEPANAQARDLLRNTLLPLRTSLRGLTLQMLEIQAAMGRSDLQAVGRANRDTVITLWICTILGALLGGGISAFFTRRIATSIRQLAHRANAIATGDLTGQQLDCTSQDQIGDLARAMQTMQVNLAAIIGTVVGTARSLTTSADSMHTASDLIHRRIDEQSQQTQQAATAVQEMSTSVAEVSRHAQSAADTARSAAQTAHEGDAIVKQMLSSMASITAAVNETSTTVGLLGDDSIRISQIVTTIDEIARKTNLLALNAAIEAARAGEQGRGFAVVAGEVRRLAESTAKATREISSMIQGIQDRTHIAIASMASGTITVEQGVTTTHLAGEALERIIGMAERVDRMIAQIAIAATQQAVAANESSASLDSVYSLSRENLREMATNSAGIESLRATAVSLEEQVVRFELAETDETYDDEEDDLLPLMPYHPTPTPRPLTSF
jgi:methyl-accepting chemotaxis protein